jgi:hypothetical protein
MDPYINVCRDRDFDIQKIKFDHYFDSSEGDNPIMSLENRKELFRLLHEIALKNYVSYQIENVMFNNYESIVLCNIDIVVNLFNIQHGIFLKRFDNSIRFCELGGSTMYEYMLWRFYNCSGFGVMISEEQFNKNNYIAPRYGVIKPPPSGSSQPNYLRTTLVQYTGGVDLMLVNDLSDTKQINISDYLKDMVQFGVREKGNCIILLNKFLVENIQSALTSLIMMFNAVALIKPMTSDKTYLVMKDKKSARDMAGEGQNNINGGLFVQYLKSFIQLNESNVKKEVLYYLNRANIHFCIY